MTIVEILNYLNTSIKKRILKMNTKYLFRVTSMAASNDVSFRFNWCEH